MSVGGFPYSQYVHDAVRYAWNRDVVLVGAAGNNGHRDPVLPGQLSRGRLGQRDPGRRRVQQLVELRRRRRRERPGRIGADHQLSRSASRSSRTSPATTGTPTSAAPASPHRTSPASWRSSVHAYPTMSNAWVVEPPEDDRRRSRLCAGGTTGTVTGGSMRFVPLGGSSATIALGGGDNLEYDNTLAAATLVRVGATLQPEHLSGRRRGRHGGRRAARGPA